MADYDNTPPVAKALAGMTLDNTAPVAMPLSFTPDNTAPTAKTIAGITPDNTAPAGIEIDQAPSDDEPEAVELAGFTPNNAAAVPITAAPFSNITMPASFTPAFTELTGGGNCLDSLSASGADIGKILQGTVNGELKSYQVRAGTDETDLPGIVRPLNFDAEANAVVFVQL